MTKRNRNLCTMNSYPTKADKCYIFIFQKLLKKYFKNKKMGLDSDYIREHLPDLSKILAEVAKEKRKDPIQHLIALLEKNIELRNVKN